jgi:hypothetical protein
MPKGYAQLSLEDRCEIARLQAEGRSVRQIAATLDRAPSTITRELKRNRGSQVGYKPSYANQQARARRWSGSRLEREAGLRQAVIERLAAGWSPEQVSGRLKLEASQPIINHESIYRFIHAQIARSPRSGKPSPSTTAPSSPAIASFTASPWQPSSAIRTPLGRKAASKTPSAACAASSPARPTSPCCRKSSSSPSSAPTTTHRENALTSERQPRPSYSCCTSNVNPPSGLRRNDGSSAGGFERRSAPRRAYEPIEQQHEQSCDQA